MSVGDFAVAVAATEAGRHGNWPTYHIVAGNEGSVFTIEPHTGISLLWSPYVIGQTIIFSCCGLFFFLFSSLFFFLA